MHTGPHTDDLQRCDLRAESKDRASDEQDVLEYSRESEDESTTGAAQEACSDVQEERHGRVRDQDQRAVLSRHNPSAMRSEKIMIERTRRA